MRTILIKAKRRERLLGYRGDFCEGCLAPARFTATRIDRGSNITAWRLFPNWTEMARIQECGRCGFRAPLEAGQQFVDQPDEQLDTLVVATNDEAALSTMARRAAQVEQLDRQQLLAYRAKHFAEHQQALFQQAESATGGLQGLVLIAGLAAILFGFIFCPLWVAAAIVVAAILVFTICWRWLVHAYVARRVKPRLRRLIADFHVPLAEWRRELAEQGRAGHRLVRHLKRRTYDDLE